MQIAQKEFPGKKLNELSFWPTTNDEYVIEGEVERIEPGATVKNSDGSPMTL